MLFCSPLTPAEILDGAWQGLRRRFLAPVLLALGLHLLRCVLAICSVAFVAGTGAEWATQLALFGVSLVAVPADILAAGWMGLLLGLTLRRPVWAPACVLVFVVLLPRLVVCFPRCLIDLVFILAARDRLQRHLRRLDNPHLGAASPVPMTRLLPPPLPPAGSDTPAPPRV